MERNIDDDMGSWIESVLVPASILRIPIIEPAHKTYNNTCATSEDSDQTAHSRSLIRVFSDHMYLLQPLGYLKSDERESLPYWVDATNLSLLVTQALL